METLVIVLTALGLVVSGVAAWAAIRSVILTKRGLETQHEQLRLQREQAAMIPELECSDVQFNKSSAKWTTNPSAKSCRGKLDLEAVVTHERGHTFGLGHVSEKAHGSLTMSPISEGFCQASERSLGRGDVNGLDRKYP